MNLTDSRLCKLLTYLGIPETEKLLAEDDMHNMLVERNSVLTLTANKLWAAPNYEELMGFKINSKTKMVDDEDEGVFYILDNDGRKRCAVYYDKGDEKDRLISLASLHITVRVFNNAVKTVR